MDKNELIKKIKSVKDPVKEIETVYAVLDELGIKYKKSGCHRCRKDLYRIALEELGLIENAADESGFDKKTEWVYLLNRPQSWHGHIIDQDTDPKIIKEFVKSFPNGYFIKVETKVQEPVEEKKEETTIPQQNEENINNNE